MYSKDSLSPIPKKQIKKMPTRMLTALIVASSSLCLSLPFATTTHAQLGGHNVIFIHGAKWQEDLLAHPTYEEIQYEHDDDGNLLLDEETGLPIARDRGLGEALDEIVDARLNWGGQHRIEEDGGQIAKDIFRRALQYQTEENICVDSCIIITASAGDLVARHFIENQEIWFEAEGVPPFNIIATIDFAGAGGGTEAANWGITWSQGIPVANWIADALLSLVGFENFSDNAGVVEDLTTNAARNIATDYHAHGIPRLRVSVSGLEPGDLAGKALGPLIAGEDDGLVPAHSSCGVQHPAELESCSAYIGYDGKIGKHGGPATGEWWWRRPELLPNHYPIIQSAAYGHGNLAEEYQGEATAVESKVHDEDFRLDVDTEEVEVNANWWEWWKETGNWRFIEGTQENKSIADVIIETFSDN